MRIVGLIPARGGSKGIPRKNLQIIGGVPLVAHKILQSLNSECTETWVSTDDEEIAFTSRDFGASIIERPEEYSSDTAGTDIVLTHAAGILELKSKDVLVLLQATSPLISTESVNKCIKTLIQNSHLNSVISIRECHPFMWEQKTSNLWEPKGHKRDHRPRRQEMPPAGWETGGCYAIRVGALLDQGIRYPAPTGVIGVSHLESIDIDTPEDLHDVNSVLRK